MFAFVSSTWYITATRNKVNYAPVKGTKTYEGVEVQFHLFLTMDKMKVVWFTPRHPYSREKPPVPKKRRHGEAQRILVVPDGNRVAIARLSSRSLATAPTELPRLPTQLSVVTPCSWTTEILPKSQQLSSLPRHCLWIFKWPEPKILNPIFLFIWEPSLYS